MIHQAFEECLFVHLSIIIFDISLYVLPQNKICDNEHL